MKCDNCGKNEATYYYRQSVNGQTSERCLCEECAQREGLTAAMNWRGGGLMDELFGSFFGGDDPFFGTFPGGGMSRLARTLLAPERVLPRVEIGRVAEEPRTRRAPAQSQAEASIPEDAGAELRRRRERQALREQLDAAVRREDYEQAITLRDKLRKLDA